MGKKPLIRIFLAIICSSIVINDPLRAFERDTATLEDKQPPELEAPIPTQRLRFSIDSLPLDSSQRGRLLEDYFSEHLVSIEQDNTNYEVILERPCSPYGCYLFDSTLKEGLEWWRPETRVRDIPAEYRLHSRGFLAIEDQWMPLAWSYYFSSIGYLPKEIILLHIDDHRDMMSPRIEERNEGVLFDLLTSKAVSFLDPKSVKESILSGAIGKGSIISPLAWCIDKIHIRHLTYRVPSSKFFHIEKTAVEDELFTAVSRRISLETKEVSAEHLDSQSNYLVTNDLRDWLKDLPLNVPVLFHIDMDYFNNRYDGNSAWETEHKDTHDLELNEQIDRLENIFLAINSSNITSMLADISVGISAGFFPAEYWKVMVEKVLNSIDSLPEKPNSLSNQLCSLSQEAAPIIDKIWNGIRWEYFPLSAKVDFCLFLGGLKPAIRTKILNKSYFNQFHSQAKEWSWFVCMDEDGYIVISHMRSFSQLIMEVDQETFPHEYLLGHLLGYPSCCSNFIANKGEDNIDKVADSHLKNPLYYPGSLLDIAQYGQGIALISHVPCAHNCEASLGIAHKALSFIRANSKVSEFEVWAKLIKEYFVGSDS